jgi:hypothetical protein
LRMAILSMTPETTRDCWCHSSTVMRETCYKLFAREVIAGTTLTSDRFNIQPELAAKVLRQRLDIVDAR